MKIDLNLTGEPAQSADYAKLCAALLAAQAATPTAQAAREARVPVQPRLALEQLFGPQGQEGDFASSLEHRFAPDLPAEERP